MPETTDVFIQGVKTDGRHIPNGNMDQCQCVWNHQDKRFYTTTAQCNDIRATGSNLFCAGCAVSHGHEIEGRA